MTPGVAPPWLGSGSSRTSPAGSAPAHCRPSWPGWVEAAGAEEPEEAAGAGEAGGADGTGETGETGGGSNESRSDSSVCYC